MKHGAHSADFPGTYPRYTFYFKGKHIGFIVNTTPDTRQQTAAGRGVQRRRSFGPDVRLATYCGAVLQYVGELRRNGRHRNYLDKDFVVVVATVFTITSVGALVLHHLIPVLLHHHIRFPITTVLGGGSVFWN